jgi:uncharacterized protein (TIGR01777 family)
LTNLERFLAEKTMKIFMTGGTGFVGTTLTEKFTQKGHQVTVLTRAIGEDRDLPQGASYLEGDPTEKGPWQEKVPQHDVIVNLAGASIFRRWSDAAKEAIRESRILTTQNLVEALSARKGEETLLLSTSAVGYYGPHGDGELDEQSPPGEDFLASLAQEWESSALEAEAFGARVVLLRFGIVLGRKGGALGQMVPLFKLCLGSPLGSGQQWFSWIHEEDLARVYLYAMERKDFSGAINCTAPNPVRNKELTKILGEILGRPTFLPAVPGCVIKMIMGEFGSVLLEGQKVLPKKLLEMGFTFAYPEMRQALQDLVGEDL